MTHDELRDLAGAYAIGAVTDEERRAIDAHLAGCPACVAEVASYSGVVEALARHVPAQQPSPALRSRVLAQTQTSAPVDVPAAAQPRGVSATTRIWLAAAAVLCLALGIYAAALHQRLSTLEREYQGALARADAAVADVERWRLRATASPRTADVLASGDVVKIDLAGQPAASGARARALWSRSQGLVFAADGLPALEAHKVYQLWMVTASAPISAGILVADGQGRFTLVTRTDPNVPPPVALAVTLEPEGGVASPTGAKYLLGAP